MNKLLNFFVAFLIAAFCYWIIFTYLITKLPATLGLFVGIAVAVIGIVFMLSLAFGGDSWPNWPWRK